MNIKVKDIAAVIEKFAPLDIQEHYDNTGLQIGSPDMEVKAAMVCLDLTEEIVTEAASKECNLIITHHPLLFRGLKHITGENATQRIVRDVLKCDMAVYSAHTNLDSTTDGVSHEIAHRLGLTNIHVLEPKPSNPKTGLGVIGEIVPSPKIEFLRKLKEIFNVKSLRYSSQSPTLVIRKVAICGGAGADLIPLAIKEGADIMVTGDVKYHDFASYGSEIVIADIGHYESELCSEKILIRILKASFPDIVIYQSETEKNPVNYL